MIEVNDDKIKWKKGMTVTSLLKECKFTWHSLIVKINDEIIIAKKYKTTKVPDKAVVKVIHMMTGG